MDHGVQKAIQKAILGPWLRRPPSLRRARQRERWIVKNAADLLLAHGVGGTSLDDICTLTATSKSQLFHYFPGGKSDLVGAIASFQSERVLEAQRPYLDTLDTWEAWEGCAMLSRPTTARRLSGVVRSVRWRVS